MSDALPTVDLIERARAFLAPLVTPSRVVRAPWLERDDGAQVFLKLECELPTASFKVRGALFALECERQRQDVRIVVTSSTGNHGAAVAFAAQKLGVPATIFLPQNPNPAKRARIDGYGARIVEFGRDIAEAAGAAKQYAEQTKALYLDDITSPFVAAATATIGVEIAEQVPGVRTIVVPMGDTALIRGVAAGAKSRVSDARIIGVQAQNAPAYYLSWKRGERTETDSCDTIADGLATRTPREENVAAIRAIVDDVVLVSEEELVEAMRRLVLDSHIVAEPAGAAATAAALQLRTLESPAVLLVSGANLSAAMLARL